MRKQMKEAFLKEEKKQVLSERTEYANRLFEKWSKKDDIGKGMDKIMEQDEKKAHNLAIVLENQENYLSKLTETQISNDFQTTPENVLRVVRLGYPNSVRGEIFFDYPMVTARDSIYYLSPVYSSTDRGASAGNITHESSSYRYATEIEEETIDVADGSTATFDSSTFGELSTTPIRPFTVKVLRGGVPVAVDDGSGNLVGDAISSGTVEYNSGEFDFTFTSNPADGTEIIVQYHFDSEDETLRDSEIKSVELQLTDYQMRARPYPLYVSWSKMAELLLGTTLDIDAEQSLIAGAGDELKKSLDYLAVKMGYRYSKGNSLVTFNADWSGAGSDSEKAHVQSVTKTIKQGANAIYNVINRGGITNLVAGTDVVALLTLHDQFNADGAQPEVGIFRVGTLLGKPVYQAPNDVVPADEMLGTWRNPNADGGDYSIVFGTLIPLYQTQTLEFKEGYSETGLFHFGDWKAIQKKYLIRFKFNNL